MRRNPARASSSIWPSSKMPFVVKLTSSIPGTATIMRTSSCRSLRTNGSPPVSRTSWMPSAAATFTTCAISS